MEHHYSIYGLRLESDQPLPGLPSAEGASPADVRVWTRRAPKWATEAASQSKQPRFDSGDAEEGLPASVQVWRYAESGAFHFAFGDGVEFVIDGGGGKIRVICTGNATPEDAASYLVGVILGFALRLKGRIAIHASVVAVDGRAIVLLGDAGWGKSTTAAAFAVRGYEILGDDVCVPVELGGNFWVEPGYPGIRLWPDAVEAFFGSSDALPKIAPAWDKQLLDLCQAELRFHATRLPIGGFYWLSGPGPSEVTPCIKRLRAAELMMKLVAMSYPGYLLDGAMKSDEFETLARLAAKVPGNALVVSDDLSAVGEICRAVVDDFRRRSCRVASGV